MTKNNRTIIANRLYCLVYLWDTSDQHLDGRYVRHLPLGYFFGNLLVVGRTLSLCKVTPIKLSYMYVSECMCVNTLSRFAKDFFQASSVLVIAPNNYFHPVPYPPRPLSLKYPSPLFTVFLYSTCILLFPLRFTTPSPPHTINSCLSLNFWPL